MTNTSKSTSSAKDIYDNVCMYVSMLMVEVQQREVEYLSSVNLEYISLRFNIRKGELDFPVDSSRSNECRIQAFDLVGRHYHLRHSTYIHSYLLTNR